MVSAAKKVLDEALALPKEEREAVFEVLLTSLEWESSEEVERAWSDELVRRIERYRRGDVVPVDWEEARRRVRGRHGYE